MRSCSKSCSRSWRGRGRDRSLWCSDAAGMGRSSSTLRAVLAESPRVATVQKPTDRLSNKRGGGGHRRAHQLRGRGGKGELVGTGEGGRAEQQGPQRQPVGGGGCDRGAQQDHDEHGHGATRRGVRQRCGTYDVPIHATTKPTAKPPSRTRGVRSGTSASTAPSAAPRSATLSSSRSSAVPTSTTSPAATASSVPITKFLRTKALSSQRSAGYLTGLRSKLPFRVMNTNQ